MCVCACAIIPTRQAPITQRVAFSLVVVVVVVVVVAVVVVVVVVAVVFCRCRRSCRLR